ncbi:MAG: DUF2306 domain-containing protein, partial [bacterium]
IVMTLLASLIVLVALRYLTLDPEVFFPAQKEVYVNHAPMLLTHVLGGTIALFLGPWQFRQAIRNKHLQVHRWMGRLYLVAVLFGGIGGLYMAALAYGGLPARVGFGMLAVLWLTSGGMAYLHSRQKNVATHRVWMIRNYSLTFAAVTLRLWLPLFQVIGYEFKDAYITVAWLAWAPNLLAAEIFIGWENAGNKRNTFSLHSQRKEA